MKKFMVLLGAVCCCCFLQTGYAQTNNFGAQAQQMQPGQPAEQAQQYQSAPQVPEMKGIRWYTNFQQAANDARQSQKPMLLFFTGSDWCGWCKKIQQEVFSNSDFARSVGGDFIFVEIDFPMNKQLPPDLAQQNAQLKRQFGITGYPTVIILDSQQNIIAETGYRAGGGRAYADYLKQFVQ